jgi:HNH endonuclease
MLIDPADGSVLEVSRRRFPSPGLRRFVEARDRTCSFPGCLRPAQQCDIDHVTPHGKGGWTAKENLEPACKHHHRLKDEGGWTVTRPHPGRLTWKSPENRVYHVTPEPYSPDDPPPF